MPKTVPCAQCQLPILHRHELCLMGRPTVALHERCVTAWQAARGVMWRSSPINRLGGLIRLNLMVVAVLAVASLWVPWERLRSIWPLLLVINAGPLLVRASLWWSIERHVPH